MDLLETVRYWAKNPYFDKLTKQTATRLLQDEHSAEREDCFNGVLEFGTGGLRGQMGVGTNRMNRYTVMQATEGLARVIENLEDATQSASADFTASGVVIGYDSRNHSRFFAGASAEVLCAHGIPVFLFTEIAPTPLVCCELIRRSGRAAIIITASHNPPDDNGYKVYWSHGGQIIPPIDAAIIDEVKSITRIDGIPRMDLEQARNAGLLEDIQYEADQFYFSQVEALSWGNTGLNQDYGVIYSPLHGTGGRLVPELLKRRGFRKFHGVSKQMVLDGNFSTVISPNPEDPKAFEMALTQASGEDELIIANDPDADRLGVMVRDSDRKWQWLNGNQIGILLLDHGLTHMQENGTLPRNGVFVNSIVSSPLALKVARSFGLKVLETLPGFKWIYDAALQYETSGQGRFVFGMEESHGYMSGTYTGDKDGVWAAMAFAEMGAFLKSKGRNVLQQYESLLQKHGNHLDVLSTITHKGTKGTERIRFIMDRLRNKPPRSLGGLKVKKRTDLLSNEQIDTETGQIWPGPGLPASNVMLLELEGGSRLIARPSGTEPKIKFYFNLSGTEMPELKSRLKSIQKDLEGFQEILSGKSEEAN